MVCVAMVTNEVPIGCKALYYMFITGNAVANAKETSLQIRIFQYIQYLRCKFLSRAVIKSNALLLFFPYCAAQTIFIKKPDWI